MMLLYLYIIIICTCMYIGTPCKFNDTPEITQCCIEDFFLGGGGGGTVCNTNSTASRGV